MNSPIPLSLTSHPPADETELLRRADALAGYTLGTLSAQAGLPIPANLKRNKGWIGALLERYLGASAGSKPEQDFAAIGVELKTIPVDSGGRPLETTCVCLAPLTGNSGVTWETSHVRYKLARVLWIPVEGLRTIPLARRRIGAPLLWSPNAEEELQLRRDWEELMDLIVLGKVACITAHHGEVLQLRPKAANGRALAAAVGACGQPILTLPRGFYLKKTLPPSCWRAIFSYDRIFCQPTNNTAYNHRLCFVWVNVGNVRLDRRPGRMASVGNPNHSGNRPGY